MLESWSRQIAWGRPEEKRRARQTERARERHTKKRGGTCQGRVTAKHCRDKPALQGTHMHARTRMHTRVGPYPDISFSGDGFPCIQVNHLRRSI